MMHANAVARSGRTMVSVFSMAWLLIVGIVQPGQAVAAAPADLTVWVSPTGSDGNDGLSAATPFKTLQRASDWLCSGGATCPGRGQPVVIRLAQTTFKAAANAKLTTYRFNPGDGPAVAAVTTTAWHYFDPQFPTTFQPWNYQPGDDWAQVAASGGYPTFDGEFTTDSGFVFVPLTARRAAGTGLNFVYTRWQRFTRSPIVLSGGLSTMVTDDGITVYVQTDFTANGVTFYGNYFYQVGNHFRTSNPLAFGAILTNNSSGNVFRNNHFVQLMNRTADQDTVHVHGLYISHGSNNALVEGNSFEDITGDAVRQRDRSNGTVVRNNTFTQAGAFAYFDDYYCRPDTPNSYCAPKEYRSFNGVFSGNTLNGLYPSGISGRRTVFCHDQPAGLCPTNRIRVAD
jgi:hypothetical protein